MLDFGFEKRKSVLDEEDEFNNEAYQREKEARQDQIDNVLFPDYGDDYDDYAQKRRRKLFSLTVEATNNTLKNTSDTRPYADELQRRQGKDAQPYPEPQKPAEPLQSEPTRAPKHRPRLQQNRTELKLEGRVKNVEQIKKGKLRPAKRQKLKSLESAVRPGWTNPPIPADRKQERPVVLSERHHIQRSHKMNNTHIQRFRNSRLQHLERAAPLPEKPTVAKQRRSATTKRFTTTQRDTNRSLVRLNQRDADIRKHLRDKEIELNMPLQPDLENSIHRAKITVGGQMDKKRADAKGEEDQAGEEDEVHSRPVSRIDRDGGERDSLWGPEEEFGGADDEDLTPAPVFDTEVNWSQTFQVNHLDLQAQRSDWIDLNCNVSGNLLLHSSDALPMVNAFMDQLNKKHHG